MRKQLISAGTKMLTSEANKDTYLKALTYLILCGIEPGTLKGLSEETLSELATVIPQSLGQKDTLAKHLYSSKHTKYILHATITLLFMKGTGADVLCPFCGFSRATLFNWQKRVLDGGWKALMRKPGTGRPYLLNSKQMEELKYDLWLVIARKPLGKRISVYIWKTFGIKMSERSCQALYKKLVYEMNTWDFLPKLIRYNGSELFDLEQDLANCKSIYEEEIFPKKDHQSMDNKVPSEAL